MVHIPPQQAVVLSAFQARMRLLRYILRNRLPKIAAVLLLCTSGAGVMASGSSGEKIYHDECARCHGAVRRGDRG